MAELSKCKICNAEHVRASSQWDGVTGVPSDDVFFEVSKQWPLDWGQIKSIFTQVMRLAGQPAITVPLTPKTLGNRYPEMRYAGYSGEPLKKGASTDEIAAFCEGIAAREPNKNRQ